jgi:hypothetical protein
MAYNYKEINLKGCCTHCEMWDWDWNNNEMMWCMYQNKQVPNHGTCDKYEGD